MGWAWELDVRGWEQMFREQVGVGLQLQPRAKLYSSDWWGFTIRATAY